MLNKISNITNINPTLQKKFSAKKVILGSMLAGSLLAGGLSSCTGHTDRFEKEKIENVQIGDKKFVIIKSNQNKEKNADSSGGAISGLKYISEKDSPAKNLGKRLSVGLIGGLLGGLAGVFRKDKSVMNQVSHCAAAGAAAGILFPGVTLTAIVTLLSAVAGGAAGTFLSGGNDKVGKISAAVFAILTAAACIL